MTIHPLLPLWLIVCVLIALSIFFVWQESNRAMRFAILRISAVCIMMLSLAGILLKPDYTTSGSRKLLLLTRGYDKDKVDSVQKKNKSMELRHLGAVPYKDSKGLGSYRELSTLPAKLQAIFGQGLPNYALDEVDAQFDYFPGIAPEGVTALKFPERFERNIHQVIRGDFNAVTKSKLYLESPSDRIDSVLLRNGTNHFEFGFIPRVKGKITFTLSAVDSIGNSTEEKIPLEVMDSGPLNILIIQRYPTFELQYLKNFLAAGKHKIALRSQLSKQIFKYEYANRQAIDIRINEPVLDKFDLLILDGETILGLSSLERSVITACVARGMGLLTLLHGLPSRSIPRDLLGFDSKSVNADTTTVRIGTKNYNISALAIRPLRTNDLVPVISNVSGILAGYEMINRGKVAFQLLQETYRLTLAGDSTSYALLWGPLIDKVARTRKHGSSIRILQPFPCYTDEPFDVEIIAMDAPDLFADSIQVPVREDELIDDLWHATVWAGDRGWHQLTSKGDTLNYFSFQAEEWNALRVTNQMRENLIASRKRSIDESQARTYQEQIPVLWFYIGFVISAGFLWLAPKL